MSIYFPPFFPTVILPAAQYPSPSPPLHPTTLHPTPLSTPPPSHSGEPLTPLPASAPSQRGVGVARPDKSLRELLRAGEMASRGEPERGRGGGGGEWMGKERAGWRGGGGVPGGWKEREALRLPAELACSTHLPPPDQPTNPYFAI